MNIFLFRIQPIQTRQCFLKSTTIYNGICTTRAEFVLHYNSHIHQMQSFDVNHLSQSSILWLCLFLRARTFAFVAVLSNYHGPELLRGLCQSKTAWWRSLRHFSFHCSPLLSKTKKQGRRVWTGTGDLERSLHSLSPNGTEIFAYTNSWRRS